MANQNQINSKQRVVDHGEVFTAAREVNAMLDLVKHETERIDSRFLEPACGNGNFLAEILDRKLAVVKRRYGKNPADYEKYSVLAITSIYGIDLLMDNVIACRERMFAIWEKAYKNACRKKINKDCHRSVKYILERNIVCGDALSLELVDENGKNIKEPIVFSEWSFITGSNLQRSDYTLNQLLNGNNKPPDIFKDTRGENNVQKVENGSQLSFTADPAPSRKKTVKAGEGVFLKKYISHYKEMWKNAK